NGEDERHGGDVQVGEFGCLLIEEQRCAADPDEAPYDQGDYNGQPIVPPVLGEWMCHHPVPLHTQTHNEQDRAVHVPIEKAHQDFTHSLTKGPVVAIEVVVNFQGEPYDKQEVSQRQVRHV
uniref:Uncharacterized protein n=1 Tax=Electrophorus electricus TaxID=8005 RepID=A0A4W4FC63_ELEEL